MTRPPVTAAPERSRTLLTRARIVEAARQELGRDPDASLGDIAEAAGVVRRTVYGHFNGRAALVEGLVEDAAQALRQALAVPRVPAADVVTELARFVLAVWPVGDRYRILLRLTPQDLGADRLADVVAPARDMAEAIIGRGQRQGVFQTSVPSAVLTRALEGHLLGLLDCVNGGAWSDDGTGAATAALIAMGVNAGRADTCVQGLVRPEDDGTQAPSRSITRRGEPCASPRTTRSTSASPATATAPCL